MTGFDANPCRNCRFVAGTANAVRFWQPRTGAQSGAARSHAAATANFQGNCSWNATDTQHTCSFDAKRPASAPSACPGSFIWKYLWDFDDGSTALTGNSVVSHPYAGWSEPLVSLTVLWWNGENPIKVRHVCAHFGTPGCIQVDGTWN